MRSLFIEEANRARDGFLGEMIALKGGDAVVKSSDGDTVLPGDREVGEKVYDLIRQEDAMPEVLQLARSGRISDINEL